MMDNQNDEKIVGAEASNKVKDIEKKPDNTNYRKVTKDDESEVFACNVCNWEAVEAKRVKQHISKKHRERSRDSDDEDEETKKIKRDEANLLEDSVLDQWDKSSMVTSTQVVQPDDILMMYDEEGNPLISDDTRAALERTGNMTVIEKEGDDKLNSENNRGTEMELQILTQTKEISALEEKLKVKEDLYQMSEAKINSLEIDGLQKQAKLEKFNRIVVNVTADNKKLKEDAKAGSSSELRGKVKKLSEEIKEKNKKQDDSEKKINELMKKLAEETNMRAKAEAEVVRATKMIDYLHEILDKKKRTYW